ncbi:MAG TPA: membrane trafficking protein [Clostridiaceae bacterium]|nr:membrane trafficking protein [Clostridiaceae bacterium]
MNNSFNKKLSEVLGKMDEKVLQAKLNAAIDMLQNGDMDEIARRLNKIDKNELLAKINELDESKLRSLNINKEEIKRKVSDADLDNLKKLIGEHGDEIIAKIKDIIR